MDYSVALLPAARQDNDTGGRRGTAARVVDCCQYGKETQERESAAQDRIGVSSGRRRRTRRG